MGKRNKIPKTSIQSRIPSPILVDNNHITFSFKHLDPNHKKFKVSECRENYLSHFLDRLKELSKISFHDFKIGNYSKTINSHPIHWAETTEPNGFLSLNPQLRDCEPWQFGITKNEHGRVHGFMIDNIYYIVWIDPNHRLYT